LGTLQVKKYLKHPTTDTPIICFNDSEKERKGVLNQLGLEGKSERKQI
jgi:hypothetical protein